MNKMIKKIKIAKPDLDKAKSGNSKQIADEESEDILELEYISKQNHHRRKEDMAELLHFAAWIIIFVFLIGTVWMILSLLIYYCTPESWAFLYSCRLKADQIDVIKQFFMSSGFIGVFAQAKKTYLKRYK